MKYIMGGRYAILCNTPDTHRAMMAMYHAHCAMMAMYHLQRLRLIEYSKVASVMTEPLKCQLGHEGHAYRTAWKVVIM